ncbi:MAG: hypothetical protein QXU28_06045 [Nitrososphaerota archaeon]
MEEKTDIKSFEAEENKLSFTEEELEALKIWMKSGKPEEAIEHYRNIVSQLDPLRYIEKIKSFRERVESLSNLNIEVAMLRKQVLEELKKEVLEEAEEFLEAREKRGSIEKRERDLDRIFTEIEEQEFEDEEFEEGGGGGYGDEFEE